MTQRKRPAPPQDRPIPTHSSSHQSTDHRPQDGYAARRAASRRLIPLHCGCADPWPCQCTEPPLSDSGVDGWRDAAEHVLSEGRMPLVPMEVRRALYRRGGTDRELAIRLHRGCGGAVA